MPLIDPFIAELEQESTATRSVLELCPESLFGWKPHPKSMSFGDLAQHVAQIVSWIPITLTTTELDFAVAGKNEEIKTNKGLLAEFEKNLAESKKLMQGYADKDLAVIWTLRVGPKVILALPRIAVLRSFCYSHLYHHRGQLTVYLRLNNIPLPSVYGPTADAPSM